MQKIAVFVPNPPWATRWSSQLHARIYKPKAAHGPI